MSPNREQSAYGFIEIRGLGFAIEVADAMLKAANIKIQSQIQTDPAMITLLVIGSHGACHAALSAGLGKVNGHDIVISWKLIGRPEPDIDLFIPLKIATPLTNHGGSSTEAIADEPTEAASSVVADASSTQIDIREVLLSDLKSNPNGLRLSQFSHAPSMTMKTIKQELEMLVKDGLVTRYQSIYKLNIGNYE